MVYLGEGYMDIYLRFHYKQKVHYSFTKLMFTPQWDKVHPCTICYHKISEKTSALDVAVTAYYYGHLIF